MERFLQRATKGLLATSILFVTACGPEQTADDPSLERSSSLQSEAVLYQTSKVTVVQDGDWIRWRFADPLSARPESSVYRGARRDNGGCSFQASRSSRDFSVSNGQIIVERTVSTNMNDCLIETERAILDESDAKARGLVHASSDKGTADAPQGSAGGSELQLQSGFTWSAYFDSRMEDPIDIDVNQIITNIEWSADTNQCMTGWHRWPYYYWLTGSGWSRGSYGERGTPGGTLPCNEIYQQAWAFFSNYWFCGLTPEYVEYQNNELHAFTQDGWAWSSYAWSVNWYGLCNWLLHFDSSYKPW